MSKLRHEFKSESEKLQNRNLGQSRRPIVTRETLRDLLSQWMMRDPSVPKYLSIGDTESLTVLVPLSLRAFKYEELLQFLVGEFLAERQLEREKSSISDSGTTIVCENSAKPGSDTPP